MIFDNIKESDILKIIKPDGVFVVKIKNIHHTANNPSFYSQDIIVLSGPPCGNTQGNRNFNKCDFTLKFKVQKVTKEENPEYFL